MTDIPYTAQWKDADNESEVVTLLCDAPRLKVVLRIFIDEEDSNDEE